MKKKVTPREDVVMELEKDIEKYFKNKIKQAGGKSMKWTCPGVRGVPDQIVFFPNGKSVLVEMKRPTGSLRKLQEKTASKLRELNQQVYACYTKYQADRLVQDFTERGYFDA